MVDADTDLVDKGGEFVDAGLNMIKVEVEVNRSPRQRRQTGTQ